MPYKQPYGGGGAILGREGGVKHLVQGVRWPAKPHSDVKGGVLWFSVSSLLDSGCSLALERSTAVAKTTILYRGETRL
jgi:hypothetical protein